MSTEKYNIIKNYPMLVTLEISINIINQMQNCICKIKNENGEGTGFFCTIKEGEREIHTLITTSTLVNNEFINENIELHITINNKEEKTIRLKGNKNIYTSDNYDITIIEIQPDEGIINFLELDEAFLREDPSFDEEDGNIYILHYPIIEEEQKASVSYGKLYLISDGKLNYYCQTKQGSLGSPILSSSNNKVIGIHINNHLDSEQGRLLQEAINEYLNEYIEPAEFGVENNVNDQNDGNVEKERTQVGPETREINDMKLIETQLGPEVNESEVCIKRGNNLNNKNEENKIVGEMPLNQNIMANNSILNNNFFDENEKIYINKTNSIKDDNNIKNMENNDEVIEKLEINDNSLEDNNLEYIDNNQINLQNNLEKNKNNNDKKNFGSKSINNNIFNFNNNINNLNKFNNNNNQIQMKNSCPFSNNQMNNALNNNQESFRNSMIYSNEKNEIYSFTRYKKATTTGLKNLGNTSYLNSVLYLLGSIRPLASYFLNPANYTTICKNKDNFLLSFLIYRLYYHLYPYPEKPDKEIYPPTYILNFIDNLKIKKNPCDVIKNILMILHNELNTCKNSSNKLIPNYCEKMSVLECEKKNFQNSNNSIISNKLNWFEIRRTMCKKCNYKIYNLLSYNHIELDIKESYTYLKKNPLTIYDCLQFQSLSKKKDMKCNNCGDNSNVYSASNLFLTPDMIIFTLDREISGQNINIISFSIDETIDLTNFIECKEGNTRYHLNGMVSLISKENKFNYVSFCKSPVDQQWYRYEDENIFPTNINEVINMNNKKNNVKIPFILVYKYN